MKRKRLSPFSWQQPKNFGGGDGVLLKFCDNPNHDFLILYGCEKKLSKILG